MSPDSSAQHSASPPLRSRRAVLQCGALGLAAAGVGFTLRADAQPTPDSGELGAYGDYLTRQGETVELSPPATQAPVERAVTEDNILGPFYREGAPFRGKVTPPLEPGIVLVITGRAWGHDTREPISDAVIDLWQANHAGRYDNDDRRNPPEADHFENRTRLVTDAQGRYEYETIHPGAYRIGRNIWRPPHVHYLVRAPGYKTLVTQLYFAGDPHQQADAFIKPSLIIPLEEHQRHASTYQTGRFDIVLAASK